MSSLGTVTVLQGLMIGLIGFSSREIPKEGLVPRLDVC